VLDFLFPPDQVEFVNLEDRRLTFTSKKSYKLRQTTRIRLSVPTKEGHHTLQLPVVVVNIRLIEGEKKKYIVVSEVPGGTQQLERIRESLDVNKTLEQDGSTARRRPRYKLSVRLLSKDFPGFKALSVDFNALGLQLQTEGPIEADKELTFQMELETSNVPRILCRGKVCWCRQLERKRYLIGMVFVNLPRDIEQELEEFEKFLVTRQAAEINQRTVGEATGAEGPAYGVNPQPALPSPPTSEVVTNAEKKPTAEVKNG
jgi:hypothetical protein